MKARQSTMEYPPTGSKIRITSKPTHFPPTHPFPHPTRRQGLAVMLSGGRVTLPRWGGADGKALARPGAAVAVGSALSRRPPAPPVEDAPPPWLWESGLLDFVQGSWKTFVAEALTTLSSSEKRVVLEAMAWTDPPLVAACRGGAETEEVDVLRRVGACMRHAVARGVPKATALAAAGRGGQCALHVAAMQGFSRVLRFLLLEGADPTQADVCGQTPLHFAARFAHADCIHLLLLAAPSCVSIKHRCTNATALHAAVSAMTRPDTLQRKVLAVVHSLVIADAPIGARDWRGRSPGACVRSFAPRQGADLLRRLLAVPLDPDTLEAAIQQGTRSQTDGPHRVAGEVDGSDGEGGRPPFADHAPTFSATLSAARAMLSEKDEKLVEAGLLSSWTAKRMATSASIHTWHDVTERLWMRAVASCHAKEKGTTGKARSGTEKREGKDASGEEGEGEKEREHEHEHEGDDGGRRVKGVEVPTVPGVRKGVLWVPRSVSPLNLGAAMENGVDADPTLHPPKPPRPVSRSRARPMSSRGTKSLRITTKGRSHSAEEEYVPPEVQRRSLRAQSINDPRTPKESEGKERRSSFATEEDDVESVSSPTIPPTISHRPKGRLLEDTHKAAQNLPQNWVAAESRHSRRIYYFNRVTRESRWEKPLGSGEEGEGSVDVTVAEPTPVA